MKIPPKDRAQILLDTIYYSILINNGTILDAEKRYKEAKKCVLFFCENMLENSGFGEYEYWFEVKENLI
jgi:hypothetical protein